MASTSKGGSRRENYPILIAREVVTKHIKIELYEFYYWNGNVLNQHSRNYWRATLVPAAAVIPGPIAYIKVVAVKKFVVGMKHEHVVCAIRVCEKVTVLLYVLIALQ
jgi:hypothetical protein